MKKAKKIIRQTLRNLRKATDEDEEIPYGLKLLHPRGESALGVTVDIIMIHGLDGNWKDTWSKNDVFWPRDFLKNAIDHARIWSYGYDSRTIGSEYGETLHGLGGQLVEAIVAARESTDTTKLPIIFIAHSLGGILLKHALILASSANENHLMQNKSVFVSTYGVVFLGTPQQGVGGAELLATALDILSTFKKTNSTFHRSLERNSDWLHSQASLFTPMASNFSIKFFYETVPTEMVKGYSKVVVPRASAVIPGLQNAEQIALNRDHISMVKFETETDDAYMKVVRHVTKMVKDAPRAVDAAWRRHTQQLTFSKTFKTGLCTLRLAAPPLFVGREEQLKEMRELLSPKDIHHRIALAGLGGAGKSMIALKYALDLKKAEDMTSIFWVNASSRFQIEEGYRLIAKAANLPGAEEEDADILRIVYEWLSSDKCGEWLMVLDNADRLDVFMDRLEEGSCQKPVWNFIPQNSQGSIIFTTRDTAIGYKLTAEAERRPIVKIPKMPLDRALLLLESKVEFNVGDRRIAEELVEQLDCLPISIIQASSYMQQMQIGVAEYLERYKEDESTRAVLLQHEITSLMKGTEDSQEHEIHTSIVKTWAISFEQIRKANLPAAELLSLLGVLDGSGYLKFLIEAIYSDFARYSAATKDLLTLSLIWPTTDAFEIHSTVYWVTRAWLLNRSVFGKWAEEALSLISSNFPDEDYDSKQWEKCRQLLPHANVVLQRSVCADRLRQQRARLLRTSGGYLHRRGDFTNGLQRLKEAHEIGIKISMDDSFIWGTYDRIGSCLGEAGRFREAEPYSEKAFEHFRDLHGLSHKDTLESLSSLATSLNGQGRYRESEKLYRQAMIGYEKLHGPDHPHTLIAVNNLAHSLRDLERLEEAEMLNQRCLDTRKKVLAPNNPLIFVSMNNLASIQLSRKKYPQAISVYRDALERLEEILTTKHPTTLSTMNNLAAALKGNGQKKDAQEMFEKVIALKEEHLGSNHVSTLRSLYHLASVLRDQGFIERARETCEIMIERSEIALGCDDPETLRARNLLSDIISKVVKRDGRVPSPEII